MTEDKMKELPVSLAWYDSSCYHTKNATDILAHEFPESDFSQSLELFVKWKTMPAGPGCPR